MPLRGPTRPVQRRRRAELAVTMLRSFAAIFALHRKMQPAVLHAETAYYQIIAHTSPQHARTLVRNFWRKSSHGHYTPLAFTAEFFFAKHAGLRPNWWRARQLFLGGLLVFSLFGFVRAASEQTHAPAFANSLLAAAVSIIFVAQPLMRNLLEWPFHGLQVTWMIFAVATGWALVRLPDSANKGLALWLIALIAYGSMHVLGLGLAVVAGTLAVFLLILIGALTGYFPEFKSHVRTLVAALIVLTILGSLHTIAMIAKREIQEPSATGLFGYLSAPRYLLPIAVPWLGLVLTGLMLLSSRRASFVSVISCLFAIGAIVAHRSYESHVMTKTAPLHGASDIQVWRNLVQIAREARAANLPIPNLPLESLCGFPFMDFKYLEPLLHDEVRLPTNEHDSFVDWAECRDRRLGEYLARCPTLLPTAKLLDLQLPQSN